MRQEDLLKNKYGTDPGFRVPDGYFEELNSRIIANLPPYKEAPRDVKLSAWQRIKPYVYLAAMFAGIWLMMQVFHRVATSGEISLDNPPAVLAEVIASDPEEVSYPYFTIQDEYELEEEVSESYNSIEEFEADFGYKLRPEYSSIDISAYSSHAKSV